MIVLLTSPVRSDRSASDSEVSPLRKAARYGQGAIDRSNTFNSWTVLLSFNHG